MATTVNLQKFSRLRFANLLEIDGVGFWDLLEPPELLPQTDDIFYTVRDGDRIDLLANRFYGDPILWFVIALANDLELLPSDLVAGEVLRIPAPRYVLQGLFSKVVQ